MFYYKLYNPAGLINQLMSIELAVGIQYITQNDICIYNIGNGSTGDEAIFSASKNFNKRKFINNDNFFTINKILEWSTKDRFAFVKRNQLNIKESTIEIENLMLYYFDFLLQEDIDFAEGRQSIEFTDNMHIKNTLGWYSRFFNNRPKDLDNILRSVRFKSEYYELSKIIANSLGNFNGLHLRLTDHIPQRVSTTTEMFDGAIEKINNNKPLVLCSDDVNNDVIKQSRYNFIYLDQYILDNFGKEFSSFQYTDEVSFGILNNLVMHYSDKFIGTIGSTYSGYIQRSMNQTRDIEWLWFDYINNPIYEESGTGKYSWNSSKKLYTIDKQWFREWKESRLI